MIPKSAPDPEYQARRTLAMLIVAVTIASVCFRILTITNLQHTSLVFIGLPAILALVLALTPSPKSATGLILKGMTLALLVGAVLLGEAFVCILFAAPLFYGVGIVIGLLVDFLNRRERKRMDARWLGAIAIVCASASVEGVVPGLEFDRRTSVTVTRVIPLRAADVTAAVARTPRFDRDVPLFFKLGFPVPGATSGGGLSIGDLRTIELRHGRHPGTLTLRVRRSEPGHVEFEPVADDSYVVHWLSWTRSDVRWYEVAPGETLVTWTLEYRRRLDPAWYFAPLERYATRLGAGYLIDMLATPPSTAATEPPSRGPRIADVLCRGFGLAIR